MLSRSSSVSEALSTPGPTDRYDGAAYVASSQEAPATFIWPPLVMKTSLPSGFQHVAPLQRWTGENIGKIGVRWTRQPGIRWYFLSGSDFYMKQVGGYIAPTVIIDTTHRFVELSTHEPSLHLEHLRGDRLF
jgi:hypothetical protein